MKQGDRTCLLFPRIYFRICGKLYEICFLHILRVNTNWSTNR